MKFFRITIYSLTIFAVANNYSIITNAFRGWYRIHKQLASSNCFKRHCALERPAYSPETLALRADVKCHDIALLR